MRSVKEIRAKKKELKQRCELGASLYGPMKRIGGRRPSKDEERSRFSATIATGFAANILGWVLGDDEKERKRRDMEGDYE